MDIRELNEFTTHGKCYGGDHFFYIAVVVVFFLFYTRSWDYYAHLLLATADDCEDHQMQIMP